MKLRISNAKHNMENGLIGMKLKIQIVPSMRIQKYGRKRQPEVVVLNLYSGEYVKVPTYTENISRHD